jgi:hypothetical protein
VKLVPGAVQIWVSPWGEFVIPAEISKGIRMTKGGWYDKRYKTANDKLKAFVAEQERRVRDGN